MPSHNPSPQESQQNVRDGANRPVPFHSSDLFQGKTKVEIEHRGELYRLQITRQGNLILTR